MSIIFSVLYSRKNFNFNFWKIWLLKIFFNNFFVLFIIKSKLVLWIQGAGVFLIFISFCRIGCSKLRLLWKKMVSSIIKLAPPNPQSRYSSRIFVSSLFTLSCAAEAITYIMAKDKMAKDIRLQMWKRFAIWSGNFFAI